MRALDETESLSQQTRIAMRLVVLTARRKNEVICGRWSEIDLDAAEWEIPAERMKARRAHWVPLSRQAMHWLRELRTITPDTGVCLFPNRVDRSAPTSTPLVYLGPTTPSRLTTRYPPSRLR